MSLLIKHTKVKNHAGAFFKLCHIIIYRSISIYLTKLVDTTVVVKMRWELLLYIVCVEAEQYAFEIFKVFFIVTLYFADISNQFFDKKKYLDFSIHTHKLNWLFVPNTFLKGRYLSFIRVGGLIDLYF